MLRVYVSFCQPELCSESSKTIILSWFAGACERKSRPAGPPGTPGRTRNASKVAAKEQTPPPATRRSSRKRQAPPESPAPPVRKTRKRTTADAAQATPPAATGKRLASITSPAMQSPAVASRQTAPAAKSLSPKSAVKRIRSAPVKPCADKSAERNNSAVAMQQEQGAAGDVSAPADGDVRALRHGSSSAAVHTPQRASALASCSKLQTPPSVRGSRSTGAAMPAAQPHSGNVTQHAAALSQGGAAAAFRWGKALCKSSWKVQYDSFEAALPVGHVACGAVIACHPHFSASQQPMLILVCFIAPHILSVTWWVTHCCWLATSEGSQYQCAAQQAGMRLLLPHAVVQSIVMCLATQVLVMLPCLSRKQSQGRA